jgi:APA family basic amino acid/polyamine antiporter
MSGVYKAAALLFFSYIGFDAVSTAAEEARKPARDLPIGILGSLAVCTVLYIAIGFVATALVPFERMAGVADPLNVAVEGTGLPWAKLVVSAGAMLSMTAVLLVFQMGQPRILMSMSRDGLLPPWFARVHPRFGTPAGATILTGVVVCVFSALANITEIVNLVNIGTLFAFVVVCVGTLALRLHEPQLERRFRVRWIWLVAPGGVVTCVFLMAQLTPENWSRLALWLLIGLNVYCVFGYPRNEADLAVRARQQRRACVLFGALLAAVAVFLKQGDVWLAAPSGPEPGAPSLWGKWVGFPPDLSHGLAIFLAVLVAWNAWGALRPARR